MKLLILGASSFAKDIERIAKLQGYTEIAFLDNNAESAKCFPVIGSLDEYQSFADSYQNAIVALGNNLARKKYLSKLKDFHIPALVDPSAHISPQAEIGAGCIVKADSVVKENAILGMGVVLDDASSVEQECEIGDCCHFLPCSGVCKGIKIEPCAWIDDYTMVE